MEFRAVLEALIEKNDLTEAVMLGVMRQLMAGELTPIQIAGFLIALRAKGESVTEIVAAAKVMREISIKVPLADHHHLIDTCGTGGDGIQTFNVSTVSAIVAAAAGAKVAKHGGRSVSSKSGSSDVLEALGVNIDLNAQAVASLIESIGIGFMFAPNHHLAMKHAAPVRRELGVRTLFNLLGPLTNPAQAKRQIMGVFDQTLTVTLAEVLNALGSEHVLVVHGEDGMDEISIQGKTYVAELKDGQVRQYTIHPSDFGISTHPLAAIQVNDAMESKNRIMDILKGASGAGRDIVLLNAGAAIYVAGCAESLEAGIGHAKEAIDSGVALQKLEALCLRSHEMGLKDTI
jgi:anthranilate phosphoribosyltransferase